MIVRLIVTSEEEGGGIACAHIHKLKHTTRTHTHIHTVRHIHTLTPLTTHMQSNDMAIDLDSKASNHFESDPYRALQ